MLFRVLIMLLRVLIMLFRVLGTVSTAPRHRSCAARLTRGVDGPNGSVGRAQGSHSGRTLYTRSPCCLWIEFSRRKRSKSGPTVGCCERACNEPLTVGAAAQGRCDAVAQRDSRQSSDSGPNAC